MSAKSLAKHALNALNGEKPHSSITDWVEILTARNVQEEAFDGIPELVDSINLQPTGPAEAARAIRKKLKHGDSHRQLRALVILKALVENGGPKFQNGGLDAQLIDAIKLLAADPGLDPKVRRKLTSVLASWYHEFKGDPSMSTISNLYKTTRDYNGVTLYEGSDAVKAHQAAQREKAREEQLQRVREQQNARDRAKTEKEQAKARKAAEKAKSRQPQRQQRRAFNFEQEKPKVQSAIVEASQASNNLVNAIQHIHRERESIQTNPRVQEYLLQLKQVRKQIVRYVQLVEDEQFIGTLIDANERLIAALETYDNICTAQQPAQPEALKPMHTGDSELGKLQSKQRDRVARSINRSRDGLSSSLHPDLEDLEFGDLGPTNSALPPPLRPSALDSPTEESYDRGTLSDFSDYDSSDPEFHQQASSSRQATHDRTRYIAEEEDPFADPFADQDDGVTTPGIQEKQGMNWH